MSPFPRLPGNAWAAVGGVVVHRFGDAVLCAKMPFDSWRHKHDDDKVAYVERTHHAQIECDGKVFGLFCHLLPAVTMERGEEFQTARAWNGKFPDLSYRLPVPSAPTLLTLRGRGQATHRGQPTRQLAELKVINAGPTRYPPGNGAKAVDRMRRPYLGSTGGI